MNKRKMEVMMKGLKNNESGLEFTVFDSFFISEKSVKMQQNGIVSFFVKDCVNKDIVRIAVDKISCINNGDQSNCISIRSLVVKPKNKPSRYKKGKTVSKIKGSTANKPKRKVYVTLRDPVLFLSKVMEVKNV